MSRPAPAPVEVIRGHGPVVLGMPHVSDHVPDAIRAGLNETGLALADTDWRIDALYEGLLPGATIVKAGFHRYVIDANRDGADRSLYPGQNTTGLCPTTDFDGRPIHREGRAPGKEETEIRRAAFHAPYHAALRAELERVRAEHGATLLYDCHSIRSEIPFLFEGVLPALNIGTNSGESCDKRLEALACEHAVRSGLSWVLNGRFKGGWTTRAYGRPARACTRSRWRSPSAPTFPTRPRPGASTPGRPRRCAPRSPAYSARCKTGSSPSPGRA
jgi:N-formylglutamate deformylase